MAAGCSYVVSGEPCNRQLPASRSAQGQGRGIYGRLGAGPHATTRPWSSPSRLFGCSAGEGSRASTLLRTRADRRPFQEKRPVCRSILARPNRSPSAGLQKVRCPACCGRYPDSCCNGTILRTAPGGAIPAVAVLEGQSGFSPETARWRLTATGRTRSDIEAGCRCRWRCCLRDL